VRLALKRQVLLQRPPLAHLEKQRQPHDLEEAIARFEANVVHGNNGIAHSQDDLEEDPEDDLQDEAKHESQGDTDDDPEDDPEDEPEDDPEDGPDDPEDGPGNDPEDQLSNNAIHKRRRGPFRDYRADGETDLDHPVSEPDEPQPPRRESRPNSRSFRHLKQVGRHTNGKRWDWDGDESGHGSRSGPASRELVLVPERSPGGRLPAYVPAPANYPFAFYVEVWQRNIAASPAVKAPSSDPHLAFLSFRRDLMSSAPERVPVRIAARIAHSIAFDANGKPVVTTPANDSWLIREQG
jgi:hypothetical protein